MSDEGDRGPSEPSDDDPLLRAIARAPSRLLDGDDEAHPARVAHFRILGRLGAGGMGVVYRAHDESLRREVALKLLPAVSASDPERRQRFLREARVAASLVHPNVAVVHQVGESDGRVYIAMELVDGITLRERLEGGPLPLPVARELALQIAQGLAAAHAKGIVHRDLKPENVMVTAAGGLKLLDFGLAKSGWASESGSDSALGNADTEAQITREGDVLGSSAYMSPEQALGMNVDARSDVFSFGIVLYEMLAGRRPFGGKTLGEIRAAIAREQPVPLGAGADPGLAGIVRKCLEKRAEDRYSDAGVVALEMAALPPVSTARAETSARTTARRRPRLAGALAVAGVLAAGLFAVTSVRIARRGEAAAAATSAAPASGSEAGSRGGVAITDHPAPATKIPEAAAAYASALRDLRDGSVELGGNDLARAAKLDPTLAAANLRLALSPFDRTPTQVREAFAAASRFRSSLDERDAALLPAAEALVADPPRYADAVAQLRAAAVRFPDDAEVAWYLGRVLPGVDRLDEARATFARALDLDPHFAAVFADRGYWEYDMRQFDTAAATYDRCLALSPMAATCLRRRASLHEVRGECEAFEADARLLTHVEPTGPRAYEYLARALASRGAPVESVRASLDRMVELGSDVSPVYARPVADYWLAAFVGDLTAAEAAARDAERVFASQSDQGSHAQLANLLIALAEERGDKTEATRVSDEFERRAPAWAPAPSWFSVWHLYNLHHTKRLDDARFVEERDALYRDFVLEQPGPSGSTDADWNWLTVYAAGGQSPAEIADTVTRVAAHPPMFDEWGELANVYVPAKKYALAIPSLRRWSTRCAILPETTWAFAETTISWLRAHRELGEALEATGDKKGACAAYRVVVDRWRDAKPRSVTLEQAKARVKALGCQF